MLNSAGEFSGLHFHRFALKQIHVVQVWEEDYAAVAYLPNRLNVDAPFEPFRTPHLRIGTFAERDCFCRQFRAIVLIRSRKGFVFAVISVLEGTQVYRSVR
jgi:hypothetical protein